MTGWSRLVRPALAGTERYDPGASLSELRDRYDLDELAKLNWNEDLRGPLPGVLEEVAADLERSAWAYPDQSYRDLRAELAAFAGVPVDRILLAHGIQALIGIVSQVFLGPGVRTVIPRPTYGLYAKTAAVTGAAIERIDLPELRLDLPALAAAAERGGARLVWVCDPNNPTGSWLERDQWDAFLDALPEGCAAVVDEAYGEYADPARGIDRAADVAAGRPVIVLRTFSKIFGMAGMRLGYAIVHESLAPYLDAVQEPFNVNCAAIAAGRASLRRVNLLEGRRLEAAEARRAFADAIGPLPGAVCLPSQANFVLVRVGGDDLDLTIRLARRGYLVRPGSEFGLPGTVRVTIGDPPLMAAAGAALAEVWLERRKEAA